MSDSLHRESEEAERTPFRIRGSRLSDFTKRSHRLSARPSEISNLRSQIAGKEPQMTQSYEKLLNEPIRSARSSRFQVQTSKFSEIAKRSH
jgi:hypothetical protein